MPSPSSPPESPSPDRAALSQTDSPAESGSRSPSRETDRSPDPTTQGAKERFSAFNLVYVGLFVLLFAYLISVQIAEALLAREFQGRVERGAITAGSDEPIEEIGAHIQTVVHRSGWVRWGGLRVTSVIFGQDDSTLLYVDPDGISISPAPPAPAEGTGETETARPAKARVEVTLPHNALISNLILILYATMLLTAVYMSHRRLIGRETARLGDALESRNQAAHRAAEIGTELEATRTRLSEIEPLEREKSEEIDALQRERESLEAKLARLAQREETLRGSADRAGELAEEVRALEDLLEEATGDLESKDDEIDRLEVNLKKVSKATGKSRNKAADVLSRRFRTLYKTIEITDRAIEDIAALGDEALRLKAEESVKRLAEEADNVAVRRKVGGLPDHVHAFELGFAGKGRIYYTRGRNKRFKILLVGAKNTQSGDLDFLSRLPREEFN